MVIRVSPGGTATRSSVAAAAAMALCLAACNKSNETPGGSGGAQERSDKAAQLNVPTALFASIPADTPYVFASFEPVPRSYWQRLAPAMRLLADSVPLPDSPSDPADRFAVAFMRELKANMTEAGLRKTFGIGAEGRYAIYGIGVVPVLRLELADGKALLATIGRLQQESGLALPTASAGGRSYWRFGDKDVLFVAAVADNQLVLSGGPAALVESALPFIMGTKQPQPNMADGGLLKAVAAQHGFAGFGVGYVDSSNLLKLLFVANLWGSVGGTASIPAPCMEQVSALARRFPRLAVGYDEFSDKRVAMRIVLETDAALVARFKQLPVAVPGLVAGPAAERPLFALGAGIDLEKARQLAIDAADGVGRLAGACGSQEGVQEAAHARASLSKPLPPGLDKIRGGFVSVLDATLGPGAKPTGVEAYGVLATDDPAALVEMARAEMPPGQMPELPADGQFHDVVPAGAVPGLGAVRGAIKPRALVAAVGARGGEAAERALARNGSSPLFYVSYDYGALMKKIMPAVSGEAGTSEQKIVSMLGDLFGVMSMWVVPTDHGLAMAVSMDLP
jgi:hypothetical protein